MLRYFLLAVMFTNFVSAQNRVNKLEYYFEDGYTYMLYNELATFAGNTSVSYLESFHNTDGSMSKSEFMDLLSDENRSEEFNQRIDKNEEFKIYSDLLSRKKDFINIRLKLVDTYKDGTSLTNNNKENSNNISVQIKEQVNNVLNINTFKEKGIKTTLVEVEEEVNQWK